MKLFIVESPNKVKSISQFLDKKEYLVKASVGHICEIRNSGLYNLGIDPNTFDIDFAVSDSKKEIVKELKGLVEKADEVLVASDIDREGEAIAYHLKNFLKIPEKKFRRIRYHEVTKKAIEDAIRQPGKLDMDMVNAALARASLDKIVGYRLSPIAKRKVSAKSVGRCQTPALRLVVEKEEEINAFVPETFYEIWLPFSKDKVNYKAQYKGLIREDRNTPTIKDKELAEKIISDCKGYDYIVHSIESKDRNVSSKEPFITSTFQQEVANKLGYSVKTAMNIAQKLFEGINVGGQHQGLITYIRSDDTSMSPEFKEDLKQFILNNYGKEYLKEDTKSKQKKKDKDNNITQDAHECIRVVDLSITPEVLSKYIFDNQMLKVYELIYNRTVASLMTDAIMTDVNFIIKNGEYKFVYTESSFKHKGWRLVYDYGEEGEDLSNGLDVYVGEKLTVIK